MALFEYRCPTHGLFDSVERGDGLRHECGMWSQRIFSSTFIDAKSARHRGRWDPQVGSYVENESQFRSLLRQGQDRESAELGREVRLETVDARDQEGLAELHRQPLAERQELKARADHAAKAKASK